MSFTSIRTYCIAILSLFLARSGYAQSEELVTLHDSISYMTVRIPADYRLLDAEQGSYLKFAAAKPHDPNQQIYCLAYNMKTSDFDYDHFIASCRDNFFPDCRELSLEQIEASLWRDMRKSEGVYHNEQTGIHKKAVFMKWRSYAYLMFATGTNADFEYLDASFASLSSTMTFLDHVYNISGMVVRIVVTVFIYVFAIGLGTLASSRLGHATRKRKWMIYVMVVLCAGAVAVLRGQFDMAWWKSILFPSLVLTCFLYGRSGRISYFLPDYS